MAGTAAPRASAPSGGRTAWARTMAAPVRAFLHAETGSAVGIGVAVVVALLWANVPWPGHYETFWRTDLAVALGDHAVRTDVRGWVNEGLMALFFLVVGLEAKRELDLGELRDRARLTIPALASLGGMAAAAATYLMINSAAGGGSPGAWGAAVSTDTALALGALALVSRGRAVRLRVFLLTLVVVDDLAILAIIALAYTDAVDMVACAVALALFVVLIALRWAGPWRGPAAVTVGVGIWLAMFESGIDPVIAGLAIGLITSAYPPVRGELERSTELARSFREQPTPELAYSARASLTAAISPNERLQYRLHPWTSRVIVPLFALANAGIALDGGLLSAAARSPVTWGIVAAYVVAKPIGILAASRVATARRLGAPRLTVTWPALTAGAASAGIGFTASLLVADRALHGRTLDEAKVGVLATAVLATVVSWLAAFIMKRLPAETRARQLGATADPLIDLVAEVDPERDHLRGDLDAPVTLVEYGDFECPFCGRAEPVVRALLAEHGHDLRYVFRHLPLNDVHPNAELAAEAAEAASAQGAFWAMHDRLFEHQEALAPEDLVEHARALGLDADRFIDDLCAHRHADRVADDVASADASGVSGTPSFFVNGRRHHGAYDIETLSAAVRTAARRARA